MKKNTLFISAIASIVFLGTALSVNAETKVIQVDDSTLKVTIYNGKPPHKRFVVKKSVDPSLYNQYVERVSESTSNSAQGRQRSPGKY